MPNAAPTRAAIYIKEAAGYPDGENSKELQTEECENFCLAQEFEITSCCYDPPRSSHEFDWMMDEATDEKQPFDVIVVYKLKNFSWSLDETVLCRARLKANGTILLSTPESSMWNLSHPHCRPEIRLLSNAYQEPNLSWI